MKLFFAADQDVELWPHFYKHFKSLGFTDFICLGTDCPLVTDGDLTVVRHKRDNSVTYFTSIQRAFRDLITFKRMNDNEWWGVSELDEFHHFPNGLAGLIEECERKKHNVIMGTLIDKVATDGSIPELRQDVDITVQFPATSHFSRDVISGCEQKVLLCMGRHFISGGNHNILGDYSPYPQKFQVYHYKWHSNILKRMRDRVAMPNDEGQGWRAGNQRGLDYWEKHKSVLIK